MSSLLTEPGIFYVPSCYFRVWGSLSTLIRKHSRECTVCPTYGLHWVIPWGFKENINHPTPSCYDAWKHKQCIFCCLILLQKPTEKYIRKSPLKRVSRVFTYSSQRMMISLTNEKLLSYYEMMYRNLQSYNDCFQILNFLLSHFLSFLFTKWWCCIYCMGGNMICGFLKCGTMQYPQWRWWRTMDWDSWIVISQKNRRLVRAAVCKKQTSSCSLIERNVNYVNWWEVMMIYWPERFLFLYIYFFSIFHSPLHFM